MKRWIYVSTSALLVGIVCNARGKAGGERREGLLGGAQIARLQGVGQSLDILTTLLPGIAWDGL
ncbi:MAG: hypothetical protein DMG11_27945 [Acidobacteria bacterium]|nr:MAG: hypothetical protein DMG11_27945 [Acidobacteriota bacterium]